MLVSSVCSTLPHGATPRLARQVTAAHDDRRRLLSEYLKPPSLLLLAPPQLGAALVNIRSGTRELAKLRAAGLSTTLKLGAPLPVLLRDPLTRRACGMAEVRKHHLHIHLCNRDPHIRM